MHLTCTPKCPNLHSWLRMLFKVLLLIKKSCFCFFRWNKALKHFDADEIRKAIDSYLKYEASLPRCIFNFLLSYLITHLNNIRHCKRQVSHWIISNYFHSDHSLHQRSQLIWLNIWEEKLIKLWLNLLLMSCVALVKQWALTSDWLFSSTLFMMSQHLTTVDLSKRICLKIEIMNFYMLKYTYILKICFNITLIQLYYIFLLTN